MIVWDVDSFTTACVICGTCTVENILQLVTVKFNIKSALLDCNYSLCLELEIQSEWYEV